MEFLIFLIACVALGTVLNKKKKELEAEILKKIGVSSWNIIQHIDYTIGVKSRQALEKYDDIKFFTEDDTRLEQAKKVIARKSELSVTLIEFLQKNNYKDRLFYRSVANKINAIIKDARAFRIKVEYVSSAGNHLGEKIISLNMNDIRRFEENPTLLMTKGELSKFIREQQKEEVLQKQHSLYACVNEIIDYANENRDSLFIKGSQEQLDNLISQLYDKTVNNIKKIKTIDSEEWDMISALITRTKKEIDKIINRHQRISEYYKSGAFLQIKKTCEALISSQREFNEYIAEKARTISELFGTRVTRNETVNEDEYLYIRPYKKSITPFTAEVSATVFSSAENNPLEYLIKHFYPSKNAYPEQIQKLHLLIQELATLKEAKLIIDNYKKDYNQYLSDVPDYVMRDDEAGFYAKLGFANIDESVLSVEYVFSYTSGGGMARRTFSIPMTEETIVELIRALEDKLTTAAFTKEQRALMTSRLRELIKTRDNYTCCNCGNSTHTEPNLLLEIDHIIPVSKGGCTIEENLQTLCWKCNRAKSNKIIS